MNFLGAWKAAMTVIQVELPMILLWTAVVLDLGVQAHPQKFWLAENLGNIPENPRRNTAKISGNALKEESRTHSVVRHRSSQLQKYKAARMSRRISVDQKVGGRDGGHPGLTVWNL